MRAAFWEEPRLSKWSHNLLILSCKKCHFKVCAGGLTTGCSAVNTTVCPDEAIKEWKSEGLTMKRAPTEFHDYQQGTCCAFRANQPRGTARLVDPGTQMPNDSTKTCRSLAEKYLQRQENAKAKGIQMQHAWSAVLLVAWTPFALPRCIFFPLGKWIIWPIKSSGNFWLC